MALGGGDMTLALDRVPVDRITAEARKVNLARAVLAIVGAALYGVGWVAAKSVALVWFTLTWIFAAVKVGWADARDPGVNRGAG